MGRLPQMVVNRLPPVVLNNAHEFKTFFKFSMVGSTGAIIDLGLLNALHYFVWRATWDVMLYPAVAIAFSAAVVNNYTWNILWTYRHQDHSDQHHITLSKFFIVSLVGLGINLTIVYVMTEWLDLYWLIGKLTAMLIVLFWNFSANRLWTFKL
ncbi:MAG: GtrA family protein [Chloroflexi bacterium]|nr:GtrA family protein [Chloroflexota bacterium]